jgi:NADH:ubiquinone oxidoreductase subunit
MHDIGKAGPVHPGTCKECPFFKSMGESYGECRSITVPDKSKPWAAVENERFSRMLPSDWTGCTHWKANVRAA